MRYSFIWILGKQELPDCLPAVHSIIVPPVCESVLNHVCDTILGVFYLDNGALDLAELLLSQMLKQLCLALKRNVAPGATMVWCVFDTMTLLDMPSVEKVSTDP